MADHKQRLGSSLDSDDDCLFYHIHRVLYHRGRFGFILKEGQHGTNSDWVTVFNFCSMKCRSRKSVAVCLAVRNIISHLLTYNTLFPVNAIHFKVIEYYQYSHYYSHCYYTTIYTADHLCTIHTMLHTCCLRKFLTRLGNLLQY